MGKIKIQSCDINGLYIIEPAIHRDERGYFVETYNKKDMEEAGLNANFVQDNQSMSKKGVLRGLHVQKSFPQGKLIRVIKGEIYDVVVDLRSNSETFGKWFGIILSEENNKQLYIPEEFAHGFFVLSDKAEIVFKVTTHYSPDDEICIAWNDPSLSIEWPFRDNEKIILSEKDKNNFTLKELIEKKLI